MDGSPHALLTTIVAAYRPRRAVLHLTDARVEEQAGEGGGLTDAMEVRGVGPLAGSLAPGMRLLLEDDDVKLTLRRLTSEAVLGVEWEGGPSYEERVPVSVARLDAGAPARRVAASPVADPVEALHDPSRMLWVTADGALCEGAPPPDTRGAIPAIDPLTLGAEDFRATHGTRAAYIAGAMAGGISSSDLVIAMSRAGLLAFFGAGGLPLSAIRSNLRRIRDDVGDGPWGANLLHNPTDPTMEDRTVDLYLEHGVRRVSASAYMQLTPAIVRYRLAGIRRGPDGAVVCENRVFAKVSRPEVAELFLRPPPKAMVSELISFGKLPPSALELSQKVPLAEDITAEADSGGHTDRRPMVVLLPVLLRLRDRIWEECGYADRGIRVRMGAAGGIGDPSSAAAALAMGADYILTGSINQATIEAGTSPMAKLMLATAGMADCRMGPAPDMFEIGAQVQVLGRGTLYAQRGQRLYKLYRRYNALEDIPSKEKKKIERVIFGRTLEESWAETRAYWAERSRSEVKKAEADPHYKMALVFRWYLGMSSRWARTGDSGRRRDYQIWSGPAIGLFNEWVQGSWLQPLQHRRVVEISAALLHSTAVTQRVGMARNLGVTLPASALRVRPPVPDRLPYRSR